MDLDEYQLLTPLSANQLWLRYEARASDGQIVEILVLRDEMPSLLSPESLWKRIRLAQLIDHPAIQRVMCAEEVQAPPFVVLERLDDTTLADSHNRQPIPFLTALQQVARVAEGLSAAHRLGLCHGQIAPETIFLGGEGNWLVDLTSPLTSFNPEPAATAFRDARRRRWLRVKRVTDGDSVSAIAPGTSTSTSQGSSDQARFMAPEVTETGIAEAASDVYSLASILDWLLEGDSKPQATPELKSLFADCRAVEPTSRPSAARMALQLQEILRPHAPIPGENQLAEEKRRANDATAVATTMALPASTDQGSIQLSPGHHLGRYEILQKIGEGGMGAVFRARDVGDGTTVAIKILNRSVAATVDSRRRFAKEARLLAQANNPYVANLLGFHDEENISYLTLEFVGGGSVGQWLKDHRLCDEQAALTLIADVARGLSVAHQRGIVHRDIKPDNILLTAAGANYLAEGNGQPAAVDLPLVKLSDFGLARTAQSSESLAITYDGMVIGTPSYMSPEQCRGVQADARSDVYSLGATLFHLLTGSTPFEAESPVAMMNKHCYEAPPRLQKLRPAVSDGIERVVAKCLAKNADARYTDACDLLEDITSLRRGAPTSIAAHPALPTTTGKQVLSFEFSWDLNSPPEQLWPYVSNTDRVNHALGLPAVRYRTQVDPRHGVRRFAESTVAGQRLTWEEHPYEWIEARRMSVFREFIQGPFHWFVSIVELRRRAGGGTTLSQTIKVSPVNVVGRWLAKFVIGVKSGRSLQRVYQQIDQYLLSGTSDSFQDPFRKPAELPVAQRSRLEQRLDLLRKQRINPTVIETLGQYLAHASDQDVARIRPLALAERFRLDPSQVVMACLWGARNGLLVLLWDILCPSCRIPADVKETLASLEQHGHCEACNVDFQLDFANSVEVIFRAHPDIRPVETRTYCIGGPAFSAHVAAQTRLGPGERFEMDLALAEGAYRVRGPQLPFAVDLRVTPAGAVGRLDLTLSRAPARNQIPQLQPRNQVITLLNDSPQELLVRLERTASRTDALTAAEASCLALFREMFPGQVLSPGQMVSVTSVTLLLVQIHQAADLYRGRGDGPAFDVVRQILARLHQVVAEQGGAIVKTEGDGVFTVFSDSIAAVRAAMESFAADQQSASVPLRMAIHCGPAMVTTLNDRLDYFGNTVHTARQLVADAGANELLLTEAVIGVPEVPTLLRERGFKLCVDAGSRHETGVVTRCSKDSSK